MTDITTLSDRELIELAAEAAGYRRVGSDGNYPLPGGRVGFFNSIVRWQDAFMLMCDLNVLAFRSGIGKAIVADIIGLRGFAEADIEGDAYAAYCLAITRCAALVALERRKSNDDQVI